MSELAAHYAAAGPPRGEVVVVVGPPPAEAPVLTEEALDAQLEAALAGMSLKDASAAVAAATGLQAARRLCAGPGAGGAGPMTAASRRQAFRRGHTAELMCLWHLRLRGYRILARRFRVPSGEIDLIARRGRVLAAIEVKARADLASAGEAVSHRQRRRVCGRSSISWRCGPISPRWRRAST